MPSEPSDEPGASASPRSRGKARRSWQRVLLARLPVERGLGAGRPGVRRHHCRRGACGRVPQPAGHLRLVGLPAQAAAARLLGRWRPDRRVWRGAAQPDPDRANPEGDEGRGAGHRGLAVLFPWRGGLPGPDAGGPGQPGPGQEPGRLDDHHAGRAQRLPFVREDLHAKAVRSPAHVQAGTPAEQGPDPRDLHEPDLPGQPRLWICGGSGHLLRQADEGLDHRRGGDARRPAQVALQQQPHQQPRPRARAPALHHRTDAGKRLHHGRGSRSGQEAGPEDSHRRGQHRACTRST